MGFYRPVVSQFRLNFFGQLFAQFDTPLVEGKNIPYHPLDKYLMLVHGDQATQSGGGQLLKQN